MALEAVVAGSLPLASETSLGFAQAILRDRGGLFASALPSGDLDYGGIPALARVGYLAGGSEFDASAFARAVDRLRGRSKGGRGELGTDDLALLGIATGIAAAGDTDGLGAERSKWLLGIANENTEPDAWSNRARQLAADLLDGAGRLRADPQGSVDALATDLVLRQYWPNAFATVTPFAAERRQELMAALLSSVNPAQGELERGAIWLATLDLLVRRMSVELVPDYSSLVAMLEATQSAFRRWVWDVKPNRSGIGPARWLIDSEAHVQAFLWAVLEPRFGENLVDEQYLPGFGQKQPRFDFGIRGLKTIVEVKIARSAGDFSRIEEEVAGDLGLYFTDLRNWDRMIVYIYDDSNVPHAERYDTLRSALMQRDARIRDIVFVQRPGMIPPRNQRGPWSADGSVGRLTPSTSLE
ncbi:hypothetical protein [Sphingobium sp. SA916]|uniref:PD-(D/E)XK nuclease domain-containing protein n=1 Tax=Sphingobium sp. SA916 TaxID=1851207 RepID=UPI0011AF06E1|nr:hypothetical protein [Sphingobium sp. SA916]